MGCLLLTDLWLSPCSSVSERWPACRAVGQGGRSCLGEVATEAGWNLARKEYHRSEGVSGGQAAVT